MTDKKIAHDKKIANIISKFGLFDGNNPKVLCAHLIKDAIDPELKIDNKGNELFYAELFTEEIKKYYIDDPKADFLFEYCIYLKCKEPSKNEVIKALLNNRSVNIVVGKNLDTSKENEFLTGRIEQHYSISYDFKNKYKQKSVFDNVTVCLLETLEHNNYMKAYSEDEM